MAVLMLERAAIFGTCGKFIRVWSCLGHRVAQCFPTAAQPKSESLGSQRRKRPDAILLAGLCTAPGNEWDGCQGFPSLGTH